MDKKEIIRKYKEQRAVGGVYAIKCAENGKLWLRGDTNLTGAENRYNFALMTGSCVAPKLATDWKKYGASAFSFVVLESITQGETQTQREFSDDVAALEQLWREKYSPDELY